MIAEYGEVTRGWGRQAWVHECRASSALCLIALLHCEGSILLGCVQNTACWSLLPFSGGIELPHSPIEPGFSVDDHYFCAQSLSVSVGLFHSQAHWPRDYGGTVLGDLSCSCFDSLHVDLSFDTHRTASFPIYSGFRVTPQCWSKLL